MKRTRKTRDGARQESSAAASTTAIGGRVESAASSAHESHTRISASTTSGKRKRSRSQMTTAAARERLEELDSVANVTITKRPRAMDFPTRPSLESHSNSDEDADMNRNDGPPPPPPYPVPVELVCRYPNKPCPQPRATKKHGELHSYCAYHRLKAQEYQRTLERKKREKRLLEQRSPSTLIAATTISSEPAVVMAAPIFANDVPSSQPTTTYRQSPPPRVSSPLARRRVNRARTRSSPPRSSTVMYAGRHTPEPTPTQSVSQPAAIHPANLEPYHHPVTLQEDDIQLLQVFLMDPTAPRPTVAWDVRAQTTGNPHFNQRRASVSVAARASAVHRSSSEGDSSYAVDLDGFTFTSEPI